jgi:hypothetical protein
MDPFEGACKDFLTISFEGMVKARITGIKDCKKTLFLRMVERGLEIRKYWRHK